MKKVLSQMKNGVMLIWKQSHVYYSIFDLSVTWYVQTFMISEVGGWGVSPSVLGGKKRQQFGENPQHLV